MSVSKQGKKYEKKSETLNKKVQNKVVAIYF
jgi:hypothetical protein